jgi:hypothetical protein
MGKLVVGIIAVIFFQIAFIAYMKSDGPADTATRPPVNTNTDDTNVYLGKMDDRNEVAVPAAPETSSVDSQNGLRREKVRNFAAISSRRERDEPARRSEKQNSRPSTRVYLPQPSKPYVFARPGSRVQQQSFGRMVVERRSELSDNQTKNIPKTKKSSYLAKSLSVLKKPLDWTKWLASRLN